MVVGCGVRCLSAMFGSVCERALALVRRAVDGSANPKSLPRWGCAGEGLHSYEVKEWSRNPDKAFQPPHRVSENQSSRRRTVEECCRHGFVHAAALVAMRVAMYQPDINTRLLHVLLQLDHRTPQLDQPSAPPQLPVKRRPSRSCCVAHARPGYRAIVAPNVRVV